MRMPQNNVRDCTTYEIEVLLEKEYYRYELALKDGAVHSIIKEVVLRISELERELRARSKAMSKNTDLISGRIYAIE